MAWSLLKRHVKLFTENLMKIRTRVRLGMTNIDMTTSTIKMEI